MEKETVKLGSVVVSKAGRDKGSFFVVVAIVSNDFIMLSDGKYRKLSNPKLKRIKHISIKGDEEQLREKLINDRKIFDSEIYSVLNTKYKMQDTNDAKIK